VLDRVLLQIRRGSYEFPPVGMNKSGDGEDSEDSGHTVSIPVIYL
jgi:hypothetical protein